MEAECSENLRFSDGAYRRSWSHDHVCQPRCQVIALQSFGATADCSVNQGQHAYEP